MASRGTILPSKDYEPAVVCIFSLTAMFWDESNITLDLKAYVSILYGGIGVTSLHQDWDALQWATDIPLLPFLIERLGDAERIRVYFNNSFQIVVNLWPLAPTSNISSSSLLAI